MSSRGVGIVWWIVCKLAELWELWQSGQKPVSQDKECKGCKAGLLIELTGGLCSIRH